LLKSAFPELANVDIQREMDFSNPGPLYSRLYLKLDKDVGSDAAEGFKYLIIAATEFPDSGDSPFIKSLKTKFQIQE